MIVKDMGLGFYRAEDDFFLRRARDGEVGPQRAMFTSGLCVVRAWARSEEAAIRRCREKVAKAKKWQDEYVASENRRTRIVQ